MSNVLSTSTSVSCHDTRSNERILELLREIEQRDSDEELDDSDEDPDYIDREESDKSSDNNESGPKNSDEDLLQNEDEYLVIENYVDGQVDEFFWGKDETIWNLQPKEKLQTQIFYKDPYLDLQ